jgi:hypothetical protein
MVNECMAQTLAQTHEWHHVSREIFQAEIVPLYRPAIIRGYFKNWPALTKQAESVFALADYIKSFDQGKNVVTYCGDPSIQGRFFYQNDMQGFNFERIAEKFGDAIERILSHLDNPNPPAVYSGAISITENIPGFAQENRCDIAGKTAVARIWMGNAATVSTHYDMLDNIVGVVSGRRRFTLFPPEQLKNLYVGPIDFTLSGQPVSMVDLKNPDFTEYPRFKDALAAAEVAELEPGDALFIPKLWWHHVESLDRFNMIVNYWWNNTELGADMPFTTMMHGLLSISHLPKPERDAWRAFFDHYVFQVDGYPVPHVAPEHRGVLGQMTPELYKKIKAYVLSLIR